MTTPVRIGAFTAALVAAFALAFGLGRVVGPSDAADRTEPQEQVHDDEH